VCVDNDWKATDFTDAGFSVGHVARVADDVAVDIGSAGEVSLAVASRRTGYNTPRQSTYDMNLQTIKSIRIVAYLSHKKE